MHHDRKTRKFNCPPAWNSELVFTRAQERQNVYIKHLKESSKQDRRKPKLDKTYTTNVRMLHHEPERMKLKSVLGISSNESTPSVNRIVIYTCGTYVGKDSGGIIVCYLS